MELCPLASDGNGGGLDVNRSPMMIFIAQATWLKLGLLNSRVLLGEKMDGISMSLCEFRIQMVVVEKSTWSSLAATRC